MRRNVLDVLVITTKYNNLHDLLRHIWTAVAKDFEWIRATLEHVADISDLMGPRCPAARMRLIKCAHSQSKCGFPEKQAILTQSGEPRTHMYAYLRLTLKVTRPRRRSAGIRVGRNGGLF